MTLASAIAVKLLFALAAAVNVATLFTDAQWVDVQSFLNFLVLILLAIRQQRQPQAAGTATLQTITDALDGGHPADPNGDLRGLLTETLMDAMEKRRKTDPQRVTRATGVTHSERTQKHDR